MSANRNVLDQFRSHETEKIRKHLSENNNGFAVLMQNWEGDFNIGSLVRNANAFGAQRVFYVGKRQWDKRGAVGTYHYTDVQHIEVPIEARLLKTRFTWVGFENQLSNYETEDLRSFDWPENPLLVFGSEGNGLSENVLDLCDHIVSIPQFGSVRSLNAGVSSGIGMYDYVQKTVGREGLVQ
jgi:tRNA G18 (ribose-2'-O)-methylase SpoU